MNHNEDTAIYCQTCRAPLSRAATRCPNCGTEHEPIAGIAAVAVATPLSAVSTPPGLFASLSDPAIRPQLIKAISLALVKSLSLTAIVMIPGLILMAVSPSLGVLWLFIGSFVLMLRTYAKPWRLMWLTCLTPAIASGTCFLIQLAIFNDRIPPIAMLLPATLVGMGIGMVRARSHLLYVENESVMAKRTAGYLLIWAACYGLTQLLGMFAATMPLIRGGLLTSAMSTGMLVCVSIVILFRYLKLRDQQAIQHNASLVMATPVAEVIR